MVLRAAVLAVVLSAVVAVDARACSCAARDARDRLHEADVAWAGEVVERRVSDAGDPRYGGDERLLYTFAVRRVYKGEVPEHVEIETGASDGMCGFDVPVGHRMAFVLDGPGPRWSAGICDTADPDELERAAGPRAPELGSGRARLLLGSPYGDGGLAALDRRGRVIASTPRGRGRAVSVCPGRAVALLAGRSVTAIRLRDMRAIRRASLGRDRVARAVRCRERRGRDAVVAVAGGILRLRGGGVTVVHRSRFDDQALGPRRAILLRDRDGRSRVSVVRYGGRARTVAARAGETFLFAADPDRGRVLFGASADPEAPAEATVHDLRARSSRVLATGHAPGGVSAAYLADGRLAVWPGRAGGTDLLDARLERVGHLPHTFDDRPVLAAGALYAVGFDARLLQVTPQGAREVAPLPHRSAGPLVGLAREVAVRAQPRASQARTSSPCSSRRGGARRTSGR